MSAKQCCFLVLLTAVLLRLSSAATVPGPFQQINNTLNSDLTAFNTTLNSVWNGTKSPVLFTGTLTDADANAGPQLVNTGYFTGVQIQIQEMKAMGVKAVMVQVGFPMLYEPFFSSQSQYQQFVSFYQQVADGIRALGMKVVVENDILLSNDVQAGWNTGPFYKTLNWTQYQAARAQTAAVIAQTMKPDYMVVVEEPDTEAAMTGQTEANTVSGSTSLLSQILTSVRAANVTGLKLGAGVGSWLYQFLEFIQSYLTQPVDFIDMHIYPVNNTGSVNFLTNALTIATTVAAASKPLTMTECWINKEGNNEFGTLTADQIRARNVFSFWEPLDAYFLQIMESLAYYTQMIFMAPSNPEYYWAYQTYSTSLAGQTPGYLLSQEILLAQEAMQVGSFTSTGVSFYNGIIPAPDTTAPSTPTNLSGSSNSSSMTSMTWTASTDNIGVTAYSILRNGTQVAKTAQAQFQDTGLKAATTYTYVVKALDLGGNASGVSQPVLITTKDAGPPNPPANVTAKVGGGPLITLSWAPSTDVNVNSFLVFRGTSSTSLTQVAVTYSTTTSYTNYPLSPGTKYYFGVKAQDNSGYVSAMSTIVSATTPAPPSPPTNVKATALSSTKVSLTWSASTGGEPIAAYYIFRGGAPSNLVQIATRGNTSYTDTTVSPKTKYDYAVQAVDTGGDQSPKSAVVSVTTPN